MPTAREDDRLPDPLRFADGASVDAGSWPRRRAEILGQFQDHVYGRSPGPLPGFAATIVHEDRRALAGLATRLELDVRLGATPAPVVRLCVWLPNAARGPSPVFLGYNFFGNHTTHPDPTIALPIGWVPAEKSLGVVDHQATPAMRGQSAGRWPVEAIVGRGYALATAYCGDVDPDRDDGFRDGIHGAVATGRDERSWGTVAAWAWGLSRLYEALATLPAIDARRVAVLGHSRLGKTALWAGASDPRFALVWSNDSGCTGAALSRGKPAEAESVGRINQLFPHWFCRAYHGYGGREEALPVDQHQLLALIAPRPLYVSSAAADLWADPLGEFLSCLHADPVYRLLGTGGLGIAAQPGPNQPVGERIGYHIRLGAHDVTPLDWWHVLAFADRHLGTRP
jgi:hypothetical protein